MPQKCSIQAVLAVLVGAGFFFCIIYMLLYGFPEQNKDALNSLLGVLTTIFTLQQNYFFGSSSASKAKDETISEIAKMPTTPKVSPINIPGAESVSVKTETGNVQIDSLSKDTTIPETKEIT